MLSRPLAVLLALSAASAAAQVLPAGNLVSNPSFELNDNGWSAPFSMATRTFLPSAPDGQWVLLQQIASPTTYATIDDSPDTMISDGGYYVGRVWVQRITGTLRPKLYVRADLGSPGERIWTSAAADDDGGFTELSVLVGPTVRGTRLDMYMGLFPSQGGESFYWDAISLVPAGAQTGDGGAPDAGAAMTDAGPNDGGTDTPPSQMLAVGCGCSGVGDGWGLFSLLLLPVLRRHRWE